jgi:hypothetical protein
VDRLLEALGELGRNDLIQGELSQAELSGSQISQGAEGG